MSDQNIVDATYGATKAVTETKAFDNLTNPPTKVAGNLIADFITLAAGGIHYASMKAELKRKKNFEKFNSNINEGINNIPKENLTEPRESIIGAAAEKAKFSMNEDELREMFENLIISSFDSRKISSLHPSFADIIQQMSPLDAQNLQLFNINGESNGQLPICEIRINKESGSFNTFVTDVFLSNPLCQTIEQQSLSISSLRRIGLITTSYSTYLTEDRLYEQFKKIPEYYTAEQQLDIINKMQGTHNKLAIQKGIAEITPLGKAFINVCLNPLPSESNP